MEFGTITRMLALISSILFTLTVVPVHSRARCVNKHRSHACLGGNGKRSDPQLSGLNQPTLASRLKEARHLALQSAVQSGYQSGHPLSLLAALQPDPESTISNKLLTQELTAWLQEDNLPREKEEDSMLQPAETDDFVSVNDVTNGEEEEMTPVDMETVRDLFTALTLQRALRRQGFIEGSTDTRGPYRMTS